MNQTLIFLPMIAQVLLTAFVFFYMYHARVQELRSKEIHPQKIATNAGVGKYLIDSSKVSDNFSNLLEMPVLFYVLTICLYVTQMVNITFIILACMFVLLRIVHSLIHCTYNKVFHRLYAYASSSFVLWIMWATFAYQIIITV